MTIPAPWLGEDKCPDCGADKKEKYWNSLIFGAFKRHLKRRKTILSDPDWVAWLKEAGETEDEILEDAIGP